MLKENSTNNAISSHCTEINFILAIYFIICLIIHALIYLCLLMFI